MFDIICVTNRTLCQENFFSRIEKIAASHPCGIILREKDLTENEYKSLAEDVIKICRKYDVPCILHRFWETAKELNCKAVHLPLGILTSLSYEERSGFDVLGASCHSVGDARLAEKLGCTYIIAGHIFDTDCKRGLPGRGTDFLQNVCESVTIPVYAIGGINSQNIAEVRKCGASGACVMSGIMECKNTEKYLGELK